MIEISIVSPVYRAERLVHELVRQLRDELGRLTQSYEIILVDDRSPDNAWAEIKKAADQYPEVVGVRLSRNFGQHYAISAGLARARGEWVVVMDCDLQDRPSEIPRLLAEARKGYDVVLARRAERQDSWLKRAFSRLFYGVLGYLTGAEQDAAVANFGIYHRKVIAAINAMPESIRYFPTMVRWVGFHATKLDVEHASRAEGKSSYNFKRLLNLALDICLAYSDKPIRLAVKTGFVISATGFLFAAYLIVQALRGEIDVMGYASMMVSMWVLSGLIILIVGIVGLYVGKSFEGIKGRPPFIVDESVGGER